MSLTFFTRSAGCRDGHRPDCKFCTDAAKQAREWRARNPVATMLHAAKARARRVGVPFTLTPEDITIPERCPVLGLPLSRSTTGRATDASPSLDKIVPRLGYVPGNVVVISNRANTLKGHATIGELHALSSFYRELAPSPDHQHRQPDT
jgi:hypothetical protein